MREVHFAQSCFQSPTYPKSAMRKVNRWDVTEHKRKSPKGQYHARRKEKNASPVPTRET